MNSLKHIVRNALRRTAGFPPTLGWTTPAREQMLLTAFDYLEANHLKGDYAEFGVWRGDTLATGFYFAAHRARLVDMRFFAFDSFEGFPEPTNSDVHPTFAKGGRACDLEDFTRRLRSRRVSLDRVHTYKGWFLDALRAGGSADRDIGERAFTCVWVDCDLYESTRDVLPFVARKIKPGAVIAFDNWFCFDGSPCKGEQHAAYEFLSANRDHLLVPFRPFGWHGQSFIWHPKAAIDRPDVPEGPQGIW